MSLTALADLILKKIKPSFVEFFSPSSLTKENVDNYFTPFNKKMFFTKGSLALKGYVTTGVPLKNFGLNTKILSDSVSDGKFKSQVSVAFIDKKFNPSHKVLNFKTLGSYVVIQIDYETLLRECVKTNKDFFTELKKLLVKGLKKAQSEFTLLQKTAFYRKVVGWVNHDLASMRKLNVALEKLNKKEN